MKFERHSGLVAALAAATGWSLAGIFIRLAPSLSLEAITLARLVVALTAMSMVIVLTRRSRQTCIELLQPSAWGLGGLMIAYYLLTTAAFRLSPVAEVAVLVGTAPLLFLFFDHVRGITMSYPLIMGTGTAVLGVVLICLPLFEGGQYSERSIGNALALGAAACKALFAGVSQSCKKRGKNTDPINVSMVTFCSGTIALGLWLTVRGGTSESIDIISCMPVMPVLLLGLLSTVVPTLSYAIASSRFPPIITTNLTLLSPLLATTWAVIILGEWPSMWFWGGLIFVVSGLLIVICSEFGRQVR